MDIGFRGLTYSQDKSQIQLLTNTNGVSPHVLKGQGETIWTKMGTQIAATYLLAEYQRLNVWPASEQNTYAVRWTPNRTGTYTIEGRVALQTVAGSATSYSVSPISGPTDQQSHFVTTRTIVVNPIATALTSGVPQSGLSGSHKSERFFSISVPSGATQLSITTIGGTGTSGDADIFARSGGLYPSTQTFTASSQNGGNSESVVVSSPASGTWYILLHGYSQYSGVTLTATVSLPANLYVQVQTSTGGTFPTSELPVDVELRETTGVLIATQRASSSTTVFFNNQAPKDYLVQLRRGQIVIGEQQITHTVSATHGVRAFPKQPVTIQTYYSGSPDLEMAVAGNTVQVFDGTATPRTAASPVATTQTDPAGQAVVSLYTTQMTSGLPSDLYYVRLLSATGSDIGNLAGMSVAVSGPQTLKKLYSTVARPTTGSLAVTVQGATSGWSVRLFNGGAQIGQPVPTNSFGIATFNNLAPGSNYSVDVFSPTNQGSEYWGMSSVIAVAVGPTTPYTYTRREPYIDQVEVFYRNSFGLWVSMGVSQLGTSWSIISDGSERKLRYRVINPPQSPARSGVLRASLPLSTGDVATTDNASPSGVPWSLPATSAQSLSTTVDFEFGLAYSDAPWQVNNLGLNDSPGWPVRGLRSIGYGTVDVWRTGSQSPVDVSRQELQFRFDPPCESSYALTRVPYSPVPAGVPPSGRTVVLIHGYNLTVPPNGCNPDNPTTYFALDKSPGGASGNADGNHWPEIVRELHKEGTEVWVYAWPSTGSMRAAGLILQEKLLDPNTVIRSDIVLFGHSMGGVVAAHALAEGGGLRQGSRKVSRIVTSGSPHNSSAITQGSFGYFGPQVSAHEMNSQDYVGRRRQAVSLADRLLTRIAGGEDDQVIHHDAAYDRGGNSIDLNLRYPESSRLYEPGRSDFWENYNHGDLKLAGVGGLLPGVTSPRIGGSLVFDEGGELADVVLGLLAKNPPAQAAISVLGAGNGSGRVSGPNGIDCLITAGVPASSGCSASFPIPANPVLTATPNAGSIFRSWSLGSCGTSPTCTVPFTTNTTITATFAVPSKLAFTVQPSSPGSGKPLSAAPVVQLQDVSGQSVALAGVAVSLTATGNGLPSGTLSVQTDVNGRAIFSSLRQFGHGSHTYTATSLGLTPAQSSAFNVPFNQLQSGVALTGQDGPVGSQTFYQIQVPGGITHVELATTGGTGNADLYVRAGTPPTTGASDCPSTLPANVEYCLLAPAPAGAVYAMLQGTAAFFGLSVTATVRTATSLGMDTEPGGATSGVPFGTQPVVELRDASGGRVRVAGVQVTASKASGTGSLGGGTTATTDVDGRAAFTNLQIMGSGSHTLDFSASGLIKATSQSFVVNPPPPVPATQLQLVQQPAGATSGQAFATQPVVELRDANNQPVLESGRVVTARIATGGGTLGGTLTATTDAQGRATFANLQITGTGSHTLDFTATGLAKATSQAFSVSLAPPTQLAMITQPGGAVNGVAFTTQPVVELRNASNQPVLQSGITVTAVKASGTGTLAGTTIAVTDAQGRATFANLQISGTGIHTLQFTATGLTPVTSLNVDVTPAPVNLIAGQLPFQPAAPTDQDIITVSGQVIVTTPGTVVVPWEIRLDATVVHFGTVSVVGGGPAVSVVRTIGPLRASGFQPYNLSFRADPGNTLADPDRSDNIMDLSLVVLLTKPAQPTNLAATALGMDRIALNWMDNATNEDGYEVWRCLGTGCTNFTEENAALSRNATTYQDTLLVPGTTYRYWVRAFNSEGPSPISNIATATTATVGPTQLELITQPAGAVSGVAFTTQPVVELRDGSNQPLLQSGVVVTAVKASGPGTLGGMVTATTNGQGRAVFTNLHITGTGSHTLDFTATGLVKATSQVFPVAVAPATQLQMITQPAGAVGGVAFTTQPTVELRDGSNQPVLQSGVVVTAVKASGPGTLGGTVTATTNGQGRAVFTNLQITGTGSHTLDFTATGLTKATSSICVAFAPRLWGDANGDGVVNIIDAQQIARRSLGLTVPDPSRADAVGDVNGDGNVNVIDAQQVARFSVGLSAASRLGQSLPNGC